MRNYEPDDYRPAPLPDEGDVIKYIAARSHSIHTGGGLDVLMRHIGNARVVMLGEASYGTHEYYAWRTNLSQRLIAEKGFNFIAVDGDWPDCYRLNRYIKHYTGGVDDVLRGFGPWSARLWANRETAALAAWMHEHNRMLPAGKKAGFYGLDVYSLRRSMEAIVEYLEHKDPDALEVTEKTFACFEPYSRHAHNVYARTATVVPWRRIKEVAGLLKKLQQPVFQHLTDHEHTFHAKQNALITLNAEKYYRHMLQGGVHAWNIREQHMASTLRRLLEFHGENAKAIVWANNAHTGDARATDASSHGMYSIGELARTQFSPGEVALVGSGSYKGTVMAGSAWRTGMQQTAVPAARPGSWEHLLHTSGLRNDLLLMRDFSQGTLAENPVGHRGTGTVYGAHREEYGCYAPTLMPACYDAFVFFNSTKAVQPLETTPVALPVAGMLPLAV